MNTKLLSKTSQNGWDVLWERICMLYLTLCLCDITFAYWVVFHLYSCCHEGTSLKPYMNCFLDINVKVQRFCLIFMTVTLIVIYSYLVHSFVPGKFWTFIRINEKSPASLFLWKRGVNLFSVLDSFWRQFSCNYTSSLVYLLLPLVKYPEDTCWDVLRKAY